MREPEACVKDTAEVGQEVVMSAANYEPDAKTAC